MLLDSTGRPANTGSNRFFSQAVRNLRNALAFYREFGGRVILTDDRGNPQPLPRAYVGDTVTVRLPKSHRP